MALYYLQQEGIVNGATVQIDGEHEHPANAFIPTGDERADIVRWLDAGRMVFWTEKRGAHLDETREEQARPPVETPTSPIPPVPEPPSVDASQGHYIACLEAIVAAIQPNATDRDAQARKAKEQLALAISKMDGSE